MQIKTNITDFNQKNQKSKNSKIKNFNFSKIGVSLANLLRPPGWETLLYKIERSILGRMR
jgi:hypothetical protein